MFPQLVLPAELLRGPQFSSASRRLRRSPPRDLVNFDSQPAATLSLRRRRPWHLEAGASGIRHPLSPHVTPARAPGFLLRGGGNELKPNSP
jgi:hypothetical protein